MSHRRSNAPTLALLPLGLLLDAGLAAQQPDPISLETVLETPQQLMPQLPRVEWVPGGGSYMRFEKIDDEDVVVAHVVYGDDQPAVLFRARDVYRALANSGFAGDAKKTLPPIRLVRADTVRIVLGGRIWHWTIGNDRARRVLSLMRGATQTAIAPEDDAGAFVVDTDLFVAKDDGSSRRLTWDGSADIVYGGAAHRAEFGIVDGLWWDASGRRLAFSREDQRPSQVYPYIEFGKFPAKPKHGRYPMAGRAHAKVTIGIYDRADDSVRYLEHDPDRDVYWTNVTFAPDGSKVYVALVSRGQDHMDLVEFDARTGKRSRVLFAEHDAQWIEPEHGPMFAPDGKSFLWFSFRDGFRHLYRYAIDGTLLGRVTHGAFDIGSFEGFSNDGARGWVMASGPNPLVMNLWSFELADGTGSGGGRASLPAVSAPITTTAARQIPAGARPQASTVPELRLLTTERGQHHCQIEPHTGVILDVWSNVETPGRIDLILPSGETKTIATADNPWDGVAVGEQRFFEVSADDGTPLFGHVIYPPGLEPARPIPGRTHPVLHYVYGGPHSQLVRDEWNGGANLWLHFLASQGYIVTRLDNRGTDNRGIEFAQQVHRNLGDLEVKDQLKAIALVKEWPFVDPDRIAVHGWSYGGYMTLRLMLKAPDVFRAGIAGAPVTDWARYETGYTERYMDTPAENPGGFAAASCLPLAKQLNGRLLLVHGTDDHTVMFSHSMAFVEACIQAGTLLDYMPYPMQQHGIRGTHRKHLYRTMTRYLFDHAPR